MSHSSGSPPGSGAAPTGGLADPGRTLTLRNNRIDSRELFAAHREIIIAHGAETYRLRLTSQNKLILTK